MKIEFDSITETGKVRKNNEDRVFCDAATGIFAVADGMGGGAEGERASAIVCQRLAGCSGDGEFSARVDEVGGAINAANREIFDYATARGFKQMGSTIALVMFEGGGSKRAAVCHIGDSRVYRVRDGRAELLTRDHSVGAELESALGGRNFSGSFSQRSNPLAHVLTRAIGTGERVDCDWRKLDVEPGDVYVVSSDGVHDVVETEELAGLVAGADAPTALRRIADTVVDRGAPDNYSLIIVKTED